MAADSHCATKENGKQQGSGAFTSRGDKRFLRGMEKILRWYLAIIFLPTFRNLLIHYVRT